MISRVRLVNFISHADTDLRLGEGLTVFIGRNGSGKSSVVDAITYALYNRHSRGENRNIVRDRASDGHVELELLHRGRAYQIRREFNAQGSMRSSEIREGGRLLSVGERRGEGVSKEVEKILGMSYDRLVTAVVIRQGELESILSQNPRSLKALFEDLMGLGRMEDAYQKMRELLDGFDKHVRESTGYSVKDLERLAADIRDRERKGVELEEELNKLIQKQKQLEEELNGVEEELDKIRQVEKKLRMERGRLKQLLGSLEERARNDHRAFSKAEERLSILRMKKEIGERARRLNELKDSIADEERRLGKLQAQEEELSCRLSSLKKAQPLEEVHGEAKTLDEWLGEARRAAQRLKEDAIELGRILERGRGESSLLQASVEGDIQEIVDIVRRVYSSALAGYAAATREELRNLEEELVKLRNRIKETSDRLKDYESQKKEVENLGGESVETLLERLRIAESEAEEHGGPDEVARKAKDANEAAEALRYISSQLDDNDTTGPQLLKSLENISWWGSVEESLRQELKTLLERASSTAQTYREIEELSRRRDELNQELARCKASFEEKKGQINQVMNELQRLRRAESNLKKAREIYDSLLLVRERVLHRDGPVLSSLRTWIYERVSERAMRYLGLFSMAIDDVRIEDSGRGVVFRCFYGGREIDAGRLSGGEKIALALAVRLALGDVLGAGRLGFFILDEPTIFLDEENKRRLGEVFASLARAVKQVIVITHDEEIFDEVEASLVKFEKLGAASATRVTQLSNTG